MRVRVIAPFFSVAASLLAAVPAVVVAQEEPDERPGIAVLRFTNAGSYGDRPEDLGALEVGLQQMLLTELGQGGALRIVERRELNAILAEQDLGTSGRVRDGTEPRVGRLVGARYMVAGSFIDADGDFRMDARIFDSETSEVVRTAAVQGDRERMLDLVVELGREIADDLDLPPLDASDASERLGRAVPPEAIVMFSWAQVFEDRGDPGLAADTYQRIMELYPEFDEARDEWFRLRGDWEFGVFVGSLNDEPEYATNGGADGLRRDAVVGLRVARHLPRGFAVAAEGGNSLISLHAGEVRRNVNVVPVVATAEWNYDVTHDFQALIGAGAGVLHLRPDGLPSETDFSVVYRLGGRLFITRNHAARLDVKTYQVPGGARATAEAMGITTRSTLWLWELSVGFSWFPSG